MAEHGRKQYVSYVDTEIVSHRVHGITFGVYSDDEIKRLSLKSIHQSETFDCLGHATSGGLYDLELGPQQVEGPCITCGLNMQDALPLHRYLCPGHFGHIQLPMPVFNPILFKEMIQVLRIMCFKCHRLLISSSRSILFAYQMEALKMGLLTTVLELRDIYTSRHGETETSEGSTVKEICPPDTLHANLASCLAMATKDVVPEGSSKNGETKCLFDVKQTLVKDFISACSGVTVCTHCNQPRLRIRQENFLKVYFERTAKTTRVQPHLINLSEDVKAQSKREDVTPSSSSRQQLHPLTLKTHLRELWANEKTVLRHLCAALAADDVSGSNQCSTDNFFKLTQVVTPPRFRQLVDRNSHKILHPETDSLLQVLKESQKLKGLLKEANSHEETSKKLKVLESMQMVSQSLQGRINSLYDCRLGKMFLTSKPATGVVQLLEHKSGLMRWNMMGKRVDFAARSVISPDPCIATNEVGLPLYFARRLTYPEAVTPHNIAFLRNAVINGPDVYPGATHIILPSGEKKILDKNDIVKRKAAAKQLLVPFMTSNSSTLGVKVLRHIRNGDVLLMNRQPSLHRPSMQAHKARILPFLVEEKTLRMHYSNCKAYNADFDGDEMNAHFPQNELARSECYALASTDYQYLVPKDGTPLAGLIQDYMVSGVWLTMRGQFFTQADYKQLVYAALVDHKQRIRQLKPSIVKPVHLWSGKQVLSTVLINLIPDGKPPLTLIGKSNIAEKKWVQTKPREWLAGGTLLQGNNMTESEVVILNGHLLVGVLDKAHYGASPFGLVHCCYELYGGEVAGNLLTSLARLFNWFLQFRGFTMGVEDIIVKKLGNDERKDILAACEVCGPEVAILAFGLPDNSKSSQVESTWRKNYYSKDGGDLLKRLDIIMNKKTNDCQDCIKKLIMPEQDTCMPGELFKVFPHNNLQMMFLSGAKGTQVNCVQISCTLGQISLEGRRPPLMLNGASLPSFKLYDVSPRAGGFVAGRFLTGLRPQEYFFHCMAGREGLVDTAVKTSHSGYLQRCLIKHLEGLTVSYDMTVRDNDGSVIQFNYGEDGMDVLKTAFLRCAKASDKFPKFSFLVANRSVIACDEQLSELKSKTHAGDVEALKDEMNHWMKKYANKIQISPFQSFCSSSENADAIDNKAELVNRWRNMAEKKKDRLLRRHRRRPDPVNSRMRSDRYFGSVSESLDLLINNYVSSNPDKMLCMDNHSSTKGASLKPMLADDFTDLMYYKSLRSLVPPGDAVGLLAAQSIGEPSTQMTLNTFHFAGHQAMNVTLGIPRLREILMTASKNIKTPIMEVPVYNSPAAAAEALHIAKRLTRVYLISVLKKVSVESRIGHDKFSKQRCHFYDVHLEFHKSRHYREWTTLNAGSLLSFIERKFIRLLSAAIDRSIREMGQTTLLHSAKISERRTQNTADEEAEKGNEDVAQEDVKEDDEDDDDGAMDYEDDDEENAQLSSDAENSEVDAEEETQLVKSDNEDSNDVTDFTSNLVTNADNMKKVDPLRISNVMKLSTVSEYTYDAEKQLWCRITYRFPLREKAIDIRSVVEAETAKTVVSQVSGIKQAKASKLKDDKDTMLRTEGVNMHEIYKYASILDLSRIYTNNIHSMAEHYGIEAAYQAIIKEINTVFELYKITVDRRHLSLIADYMTFEGCYKPFNRRSLSTNPSPLQNMTFETTMHFLRSAVNAGTVDDMTSPSARVVAGRVMKSGTGYFDVLIPLNV